MARRVATRASQGRHGREVSGGGRSIALGKATKKQEKIVIIGGGNVGLGVARALDGSGVGSR